MIFGNALFTVNSTIPTIGDVNVAGDNDANLVLDRPSDAAEGDLLIVTALSNESTPSGPAGWTRTFTLSGSGGYDRVAIFEKVATGSETSTYTFTSGFGDVVGLICVIKNASGLDAVSAFSDLDTLASSKSIAAFTPNANGMVLSLVLSSTDTSNLPISPSSIDSGFILKSALGITDPASTPKTFTFFLFQSPAVDGLDVGTQSYTLTKSGDVYGLSFSVSKE